MITRVDLDWWRKLAPTLKWTFAKSMPDYPHSYMVRDRTMDPADFEHAVRVIRTFGEPGKFWNKTNIYLIDRDAGMRWWTMGAPLKETTIINQAKLGKTWGRQDAPHTRSGLFSVYDMLATDYDERYSPGHCPDCAQENKEVWELITSRFGDKRAPATLDVGCGTGLLLDMSITTPERFTGVDPSQGMLNELVRKHPAIPGGQVHPITAEAALDLFGPGSFDLVTALFGAPSYFHPDSIAPLAAMARRMAVFMHYEPGYLPDYWGEVHPPYVDSSREAAAALPRAEHAQIGAYVVTSVVRSLHVA